MELIYEIAEAMNIPNEYITITAMDGKYCWFIVKNGGEWTCKTTHKQKHLAKDSIRRDI